MKLRTSHGAKTVLVELELGSNHDVELHDLSAPVSEKTRIEDLYLGSNHEVDCMNCWLPCQETVVVLGDSFLVGCCLSLTGVGNLEGPS